MSSKRWQFASGQPVSDYWALTKPEVNFLIAIATLTGFYLAFPGQRVHFPWMLLVHTLLGTLVVAGGTGTLISTSNAVSMPRCAGLPGGRSRLAAETFCKFFGSVRRCRRWAAFISRWPSIDLRVCSRSSRYCSYLFLYTSA